MMHILVPGNWLKMCREETIQLKVAFLLPSMLDLRVLFCRTPDGERINCELLASCSNLIGSVDKIAGRKGCGLRGASEAC